MHVKKNILYKHFLKTRSDVAEVRYKTYKGKLTSVLRHCEKECYSNNGSTISGNKNIAEHFNQFFCEYRANISLKYINVYQCERCKYVELCK